MLGQQQRQAGLGVAPAVDRVVVVLLQERDLDMHPAAGLQDAADFGQEGAIVFDVLEHAGRNHKIHRVIGERRLALHEVADMIGAGRGDEVDGLYPGHDAAATGAQVDHQLAVVRLGDARRGLAGLVGKRRCVPQA